jgi:hypothetical protein
VNALSSSDVRDKVADEKVAVEPEKLATHKPRGRGKKADEEPAGNASAPEATGKAGEGSSASEASSTTSTSTTATSAASPSDGNAVAYADVQRAVTQLAAAKGRDAVLAVFERFGVDHATKIPEAQWGEAAAALQDAKEQ